MHAWYVLNCAVSPAQRVLSCMQVKQSPLTVTIVNRPYTAGRQILNDQDLQDHIRRKWPGSIVNIAQIEGLDLKQQIALFQNTSIMIGSHGAAMADLFFLPQVSKFATILCIHSPL